MAPQSKTGTLISQNEKLASLPKPFSEYYPYYRIGVRFGESFREFLKNESEYVATMYPGKPVSSLDASEFLSPYDREEVDLNTCKYLSEFLSMLMGEGENTPDRSKIKTFDFTKIDGIMESSGFKYKKLKPRRIQDFWLFTKRCTYQNEKTDHMHPGFLDLLSTFCGFYNFKEYLEREFGENYQADKDPIYQALITGSAVTLSREKIGPRKKLSQKPRELVPNAVFKPKTEYFLGREEDLNKITEQLHEDGPLVIHGEGGMGKTTVAAAYYHRSIHNKSYKTVAWLFCEQGTLKAIFDLAYGLGLNFQGVEEKDRLLMIRHKLQEMGKDFLLVLDNVENDLTDFLKNFQDFTWDVLVTSRGRMDWEEIQEFELPALSNPAAKALFKIHYRKPSGEPLESGEEFELLLDKLISAIGYNTLLIEIFAKQLREEFWDMEEGRFGLREFLNRLETQGLYLVESQERVRTKYGLYRRNNEVATATEILDILYDFSKLDKNLNSLLINLALLPVGNHRVNFLVELFQPKEKRLFRSNLKELYAKGWIGGDGLAQFRVSPVIQDLTIKKHQEVLWEEGKGLVERVTSLIRKETDQDNMHTKFKWQPVAEKLADNLTGCQESEYGAFLNDLAMLLRSIGGRKNLLCAEWRLENALELDLKNHGEDSPKVADRRSNLALVLRDLDGRENLHRGANELEKALASDLKNFGEEAQTVAIYRSNLALVLQNLGGRENLDLGVEELGKALASSLKNFGEEAPAVATIRSNLASVLRKLGGRENLDRAAEEIGKALASYLKNFGEDAPAVAICRSNLALVLRDLDGRENLNRGAEELEKALASGLKNFGEDAPVVVSFRSFLASVLRHLGGRKNLNRAAEELRKALVSGIKNVGEDAPAVASYRSNLASVLQDLGGRENLDRAAEEIVKALASYLKNFGEDAPRVATCRSNLALVLRDLGNRENLDRAAKELEKALVSGIKNVGGDAPAVAIRRSNLAAVLRDLGGRENLDRAAEELDKALSSGLKNFGEDASVVATCRSNLALVLRDLGGRKNLDRAAEELEKALASDLKNFGEGAPDVAICRSNLALVLQDMGGRENLNRAAEELEQALASDLKNVGEDAPDVPIRRSNLALVLQDLGGRENLDRAAEELEQALASDLKNFNEDSPSVALRRSNLSLVLRDLGGSENLNRAAEELKKALASDLKNFGEDSPQTVIPRLNLASVMYDLQGEENLLTAKTLLVKALALSLHHFGKEHLTTQKVKNWLKPVEDALKME